MRDRPGGDILRLMHPLREESGQTAAEYGVVLAVITVSIVALIGAMSGAINALFHSALGAIS